MPAYESPFTHDDAVEVCEELRKQVPSIKKKNGRKPSDHIFHQSTFSSLVVGAQAAVVERLSAKAAKKAATGARRRHVSP